MLLFVSEWIHKYTESFIQPENLQEIVDSFMKEYDKRKEEVSGQFLPSHHPIRYILNSCNNLS